MRVLKQESETSRIVEKYSSLYGRWVIVRQHKVRLFFIPYWNDSFEIFSHKYSKLESYIDEFNVIEKEYNQMKKQKNKQF